MTLDIGFSTDPGPREGENQDSILIAQPEGHPGMALLLVADGMGGAQAGEQASQEAVRVIHELVFPAADPLPTEYDAGQRLRQAILEANTRIYQRAHTSEELEGMGCTVVAVLIIDDLYWVASVGDSRVYLIREGDNLQLTDDHTWVNARVREGLLTSAQAANHSLRHVLDRALGTQETVEVDVRPDEIFEEGDVLLLCSDGLYGVVPDQTMASVVSQLDAQEAADTLLHLALDAPTHDNTSVVVVKNR